jgi:hypothetical protein
MAKRFIQRNTDATGEGALLVSQASSLVQGVFVGLDTDGKVKLADFRASAGPVVARGALIMDAEMKDPKGNVLDRLPGDRIGYAFEGIIDGFTGLQKGKTYYLASGGGIFSTRPAASSNDIDQKVGYALSDTKLRVDLGAEVIKA